jgi:hypothetical protein
VGCFERVRLTAMYSAEILTALERSNQ